MIKDVVTALSLAKAKFKPLKKSGVNPHFKSSYSTLDDIREATNEALIAHGLVLTHHGKVLEDYTILTTALTHRESGSSIESASYVANEAPQKMGSAMTYARRYNIINLLDLIADPDDDGESYYGRGGSASKTGKNQQQQQRRTLGGERLS
jgi:hypothetical protein